MRMVRLFPLLVVVAITAARCSTGVEDISGQWGGEHVGLVVGAGTATLEYDCASGTMNVPTHVDEDGRFEATGEHVRGQGGPVRQGELPDRHPAAYAGRVRGDVLTLTVSMTDLDETVGTFVLVRGASPRVFRCL